LINNFLEFKPGPPRTLPQGVSLRKHIHDLSKKDFLSRQGIFAGLLSSFIMEQAIDCCSCFFSFILVFILPLPFLLLVINLYPWSFNRTIAEDNMLQTSSKQSRAI
jgi:hypothetical protein